MCRSTFWGHGERCAKFLFHIEFIYLFLHSNWLPSRPGDKRQLMYKDATAKSVRLDILTKVPKTIYFVIRQRRNWKFWEGRDPKLWCGGNMVTHCTSLIASISHLTSKHTHNASRRPARWWRREDARALYCLQEAWPRRCLKAYDGGGCFVACRRVRNAC